MALLEVLSIDGDDLETALGEDGLIEKVAENNLEDEILEKAREYIWDSIDTGSVVSDSIYDAAKYVFERHGIEFA